MNTDNGQALKEEFVPMKSRIWVSAADGAAAILQTVAGGGALTYFFTRVRGLDVALAGVVWIIFGIWNAVNDPLFGYISDRTKSKLGRRIPYIRFGAPLFALAFAFFWIMLPGWNSQTILFVQLLLGLFLYDTLYTAIATSIYIMPYEMAISNKARSGIFVWKIIFMAVSTVTPLVILPIIQPGPGDNPTSFQWTMVGLGICMAVVIFFSTYFYQEKHFQQDEEQYPLLKSFVEVFKNSSFLIFEVLSFTIIYVQTGLMQGILYYFDELKVPGLPLYIALLLGIVLGIVFWINRRDPWGVKRCLQVWTIGFSIGCFIILLLGRLVVPATLGFFLIGLGFSGAVYLIPLMNGDVIDKDEDRTGLRREGMYAGVNSFITKPAISLAQTAFLWITARYGYIQTLAKGTQSSSAQTGILIGWMLVPAVLLSICFLALFWYSLAGSAWEKIKQGLSRIHGEKERKYLEEHGFQYID